MEEEEEYEEGSERGQRRRIVHYVMCNNLFIQRTDKIVNISWVVLVCHNCVTNMSLTLAGYGG